MAAIAATPFDNTGKLKTPIARELTAYAEELSLVGPRHESQHKSQILDRGPNGI